MHGEEGGNGSEKQSAYIDILLAAFRTCDAPLFPLERGVDR